MLGERSQFEVTDEVIHLIASFTLRQLPPCARWLWDFQVVITMRWRVDCLAKDLEAFSAHAKRSTVNPSDVRLAARKQPHIVTKLEEMAGALDEEKRKKRKKNDSN